MSLSSHLIVDQKAEISLMNLYVKSTQRHASARLMHWLNEHPEGKWFNAFCGLRQERRDLDARLMELAPQILGIANVNDQVIPAGGMYNALLGVRRQIPIRIEDLELGIHENPFATTSYDKSDRSILTDYLNVERFGPDFEKFIALSAQHLSR
jgi:hypothetical protein